MFSEHTIKVKGKNVHCTKNKKKKKKSIHNKNIACLDTVNYNCVYAYKYDPKWRIKKKTNCTCMFMYWKESAQNAYWKPHKAYDV